MLDFVCENPFFLLWGEDTFCAFVVIGILSFVDSVVALVDVLNDLVMNQFVSVSGIVDSVPSGPNSSSPVLHQISSAMGSRESLGAEGLGLCAHLNALRNDDLFACGALIIIFVDIYRLKRFRTDNCSFRSF